MYKGQYYKHWYTPIFIYTIVAFIANFKSNREFAINAITGVVIGVIIIEIGTKIIQMAANTYWKKKSKTQPIPIKKMTFTLAVEVPENEVEAAKHVFKNEIPNMINKQGYRTCECEKLVIENTNKTLYEGQELN